MKLVEFSKKKQNRLHLGQNNPLHWERLESDCMTCSPVDMDVGITVDAKRCQ